MIEANVQITRQIGVKITEEDVDGFLQDLDSLFSKEQKNAHNEFPTLYKIWLEIKANQ